MKSYNTLILKKKDTTLTIILNRPNKVNAINNEMMTELLDVVSELRYNDEIKFVIFQGAGKHFCGGADLTTLMENYDQGELTPAAGRHMQFLGQEIMAKLEELEQVTIAAIHGACIGGGLALALACDFRVLTETAYVSIPEVIRGVFFTWGSTARLINTVGVTKAKEMIMLAEPVDAQAAFNINLATKVTAEDKLTVTVDQLIEKMSIGPFMPIRVTKKLAYAAGIGQLKNIMVFDTELFDQALLSGEPINEMKKFVNRQRD